MGIITQELKFYSIKWADVIVVWKWLMWANSQTGQVFRAYYEKQDCLNTGPRTCIMGLIHVLNTGPRTCIMACLEFYWEKILRGLATHGHHVEHSKMSNSPVFNQNNVF